MQTRLSSVARAAVEWFASWFATASENRRLAAKCRVEGDRSKEMVRQLSESAMSVDRMRAELDELRHALASTQSKLDVAKGQIDEMVGYQEVSRQWADWLASRFASNRFRAEEGQAP